VRHDSQERRILNLLHASWPSWTPAPMLSRISLGYGRCIHSLRRQGWEISNRIEMHDGVRHGFFRLGSAPVPRSSELRANRAPATLPQQQSTQQPELFGDAHRDA
jgi:hypothetical protein